ncbi:MAG: hypothetical protein H6742_17730 [Alphaproteobacteria bacterium]|nr:hypothetical protein [Alphaproteobacteria bacterium]
MIFILAALACSSGKDSGAAGGDSAGSDPGPMTPCNPVDDGHCMLPFPSDFQTVADDSTPTGRRLALDASVMPTNINGVVMAPEFWNEMDGFSTVGMMLAWLPGATTEGLPTWQDLDRVDDPDVGSLLIDTETGERVPHYVERAAFPEDTSRALLTLRPVVPLHPGRTYVVGLRGLVDGSGALVDSPDGFAVLRDGAATDDPDLLGQRDRYEDIVFPTLEAAGVDRASLQLAWSYTTASKQASLGRALWLRDSALAWADEHGLAYTVESTTDSACGDGDTIARTLTGTFTAPLYLTEDAPGTVLTRDADGWPYENGTTEVEYTLRVPCSLVTGARPGGLMQFGHGLLGDQSEVYSGSLAELADEAGYLLGAVDWTGMKKQDRGAITLMISQDPGRFAIIPERTLQGFVEHALFTRLVTGPLAEDPLLMEGEVSLVDPDDVVFYGISQGAVIGGGFAALSTDVDRVLLGVPGAPFTLLLERSDGFLPFLQILEGLYEDPAEISILIGLMQTLWDPGEAAGYLRYMNEEPLDDHTQPKEALMVAGLADALVPALGAHVMARSYGATLLTPAPRSVYGLPEADEVHGSALLELDFGYELPVEPVPADVDNAVHWSVTGRDTVRALMVQWLVDETATNPCDGVCDPD